MCRAVLIPQDVMRTTQTAGGVDGADLRETGVDDFPSSFSPTLWKAC